MKEGSGTNIADSTSNGNNGTKPAANSPNPTSGQINGAQDYSPGGGNVVAVPDSASTSPANTITLEGWTMWPIISNSSKIMQKRTSVCVNESYFFGKNLNGSVYNAYFELGSASGGCPTTVFGTTSLVAGQWYYITGTYDGSNIKIYLNGNLENTQPFVSTLFDSTAQMDLGGSGTTAGGVLDELRLSNNIRSDNWIKASYLVGADTFNNYGGEQTPNSTSSTSSTSASSPSVASPACNGIPDLFQIDASKTSVSLFLTTIVGNATSYDISYGLTPTANQYSYRFTPNNTLWISNAQINALSPNTTYYFKTRAVGGCNSGQFSKTLKIKTTTGIKQVKFYKAQASLLN